MQHRPRWLRRATLGVIGGWAALVAATWWGTEVSHRRNPPSCYGIGWGCTPDAATTAVFAGFLFGVVALVLLVVLGVTHVATVDIAERRGVRNGIAMTVLAVVAVVVAVATAALVHHVVGGAA